MDKVDPWQTVHVLCSLMRIRPLTSSEQDELHEAHLRIREAAALREQPEARGVVDEAMVERVLHTRVPGGSEVWHWIDGGGMEVTPAHRRIAEVVIKAYIAQTLGKPIHQQEHEAALTAAQQPVQEGGGEDYPMTEAEVRQWIDACNHEPARQVLRDYLRLRTAPPSAPVGGRREIDRVIRELRAYNPAADEYRGEHIHGVWAKELERAVTQQPAQAAPVPCDAIPKHQWEVLSCEPNEYEPTMESGWQRCKVCGTRAHFNRERTPPGDDAAGGGA